MPLERLPLTYGECRARFRRAAAGRGWNSVAHPISARGPDDQRLTIDTVHLGATRPRRALIVMSGVHGVEGFVNSALQCELLERFDPTCLDADEALLVIHAVNPWGMAWGRRQNESNVDLNRNWRRGGLIEAPSNPGYDELHPLLCPVTDELPDPDELVARAWPMVETRGMRWVRDAVANGQYSHPDGFHYGGARTEQSTALIETIVASVVAEAEFVATMDLHTGHGEYATVTLLCDDAVGTAQDDWLRRSFGNEVVESTGDPAGEVGPASGQLANGFRDLVPSGAVSFATSVEFGTAPDLDQLLAGYREMWVHHHGERTNPEHAQACWAYRCCFTPDDADWQVAASAHGRRILGQAVDAVFGA